MDKRLAKQELEWARELEELREKIKTETPEERKQRQKEDARQERKYKFASRFFVFAAVSILALAVYLTFYSTDIRKWTYLPYLYMVVGGIAFNRTDSIKAMFPNVKFWQINLAVTVVPAFIFTKASSKGLDILTNQHFQYTVDTTISNKPIKLLGKLGDDYIMTDLANTKIFYYPIDGKKYWEFQTFDKEVLKEEQKKKSLGK